MHNINISVSTTTLFSFIELLVKYLAITVGSRNQMSVEMYNLWENMPRIHKKKTMAFINLSPYFLYDGLCPISP